MKLLHVMATYWPAVRYGGPIFAVHSLCRALVQLGHEVHVFTTRMDGPGDLAVEPGTSVDREGVRVRYFDADRSRALAMSSGLASALRREVAGFDVVHTHAVFQWPSWAEARRARCERVPYVMSPRGMLVPELLRRRRRVAKALWLRFLERPNLRHASAIHFTSELERDQAQAAGVDCLRAAIIPNGVELPGDGQAPLPGEIAAFAAGGPFVLSLGRIHWKKGLDHLVRAAAQAPALRIAVVGNDEGERSALESLARELGVADRVLFAGPVYADAKWSLLRRAAAVALPSQSENFANVVLEAMAAARPVVVSPAVGLATVVRDARCGMVVEPRPDSLAEALQALLSDPERAAAMGARGRATAESEYPWIHIARRTEALYASLERPRWT